MRKRTWGRLALRLAIIGAALSTLPILYDSGIRVNGTTASLTYLLVVLGAATLWGLPEAMLASIASMLLLDYYFLPPVPSFGIDDPQNWVAWLAFLVTSLVVSDLSTRMKKRAREATERQREIERMYALSFRLMQAGSANELAASIPAQVAEIFGCRGVAFYDSASGQMHCWGAAASAPEGELEMPGATALRAGAASAPPKSAAWDSARLPSRPPACSPSPIWSR